jgi:predicted permease
VQRYLKMAERGGVGRGRLRDGLVIGEVALAFVLLAGAGLLARTFLNLRSTPTGFNPHGVLSLHVVVAGADEILAIEQRVARIPGVRAVAFISLLPLQNSNWNGRIVITGGSGEGSAEFRYVTPGYFRVMSVPIIRGRAFSERDTANAPRVLLVNEAFAKQYFANDDPIGHELTGRGTIVGIVGDVRQSRLDHPAVPEIYYPVAQNFGQIRSLGSSMVVGSSLPADSLVGTIRLAIREVSPNQATFRVRTMDRVVDESIGGQKLYLWLLGVFAGMATLLAAAGIYSVVAYLVTLRAREIGIRMALGADAGRVVRLVLGRGGLLVGTGLGLGSIGAFALTRLLTSVLYGVTATDPATFGAFALLLGLVGLSACAVPARRAARVDPAVTLRAE